MIYEVVQNSAGVLMFFSKSCTLCSCVDVVLVAILTPGFESFSDFFHLLNTFSKEL